MTLTSVSRWPFEGQGSRPAARRMRSLLTPTCLPPFSSWQAVRAKTLTDSRSHFMRKRPLRMHMNGNTSTSSFGAAPCQRAQWGVTRTKRESTRTGGSMGQ